MSIHLEETQINEIRAIKDSKPFEFLLEKTQVQTAAVGRDIIAKNRGTHSDSVVNVAHAMMLSIAKDLGMNSKYDVDYRKTLTQSCLLHDIGHPPFGHDGAEKLDALFKSLGLKEGFDDNCNNITVILAHNIGVRDEVIADIIKYPNKMYEEHIDRFIPKLKEVIEQDKEYFSKYGVNLKNQKRTIACQIMDRADEIAYTCDDMSNYFCLNRDKKISFKEAMKFFDKHDEKHLELADRMIKAVNSGKKSEIMKFFSELKVELSDNFKLVDEGVKVKNNSLHSFRSGLSKMSFEYYIKPLRKENLHLDNVKRLEVFLNHCVDGYYDGSRMYSEKIEEAKKSGR